MPQRTTAIEIVTIGDELLLGFTVDTNAAYAARQLADVGVVVSRRTTVGDDVNQIADAVRAALDRTGAVLTTGGLGPTSDDMSKAAVAGLFGRELELDKAHLVWLEERWRKRFGGALPATNRAQALMPAGAEKLPNAHGSAPGVWLEDDRGWVAMLPGVPREMRGMLDDTLIPRLRALSGGLVVRSRTLRTTGVAESALAERVEGMPKPGLELPLAYLPSAAGVDLRLTSRGLPAEQADALLDRDARRLVELLGHIIYDDGSEPGQADLASILLNECRARGLTLAVAESCTGGLLGARLTAIAGSSDVFLGGVIAYANQVKAKVLGVDSAVLERDGAVSESVVLGMAAGARRVTGADIGIGITGVAGPGGGTTEKPVGTVWIAADIGGAGEPVSRRLNLIGDREEIRVRATQSALALVRAGLRG